MNPTYMKITERMWLAITIGAFILACYMIATYGTEEWGYFIGFALAGAMYFFRRMLRKRFEKHSKG